jgi:hypothetical protein
VRDLASDIEKSGKKYLRYLAADATARNNFKECMIVNFLCNISAVPPSVTSLGDIPMTLRSVKLAKSP